MSVDLSSVINPDYTLVNPGPLVNSVLYDQENHVSEDIWNGQERDVLKNSGSSWGISKWSFNSKQQQWIKNVGFGLFLNPKSILRPDAGLISALVERWRSETNSFHFSEGEMTITLEDVSMILGLPVHGLPIIGDSLELKQRRVFTDFFRWPEQLGKEAVGENGIKLTWLRKTFAPPLPDCATEEEEWNQVKAFLLDCIGSVLLVPRSRGQVHARYCRFLETREIAMTYSWGSAILAHTYRELHKATRKEEQYFCGCTTLIQVWAYERIPVGRPIPRPYSKDMLPRALAWEYGEGSVWHPRRLDPHHNRLFYRGELDAMRDWGQLTWRPYARIYAQDDFDEDMVRAKQLGLSHAPLIHFDVIEYQLPERVLAQFGLLREIPPNSDNLTELRLRREDIIRKVDYRQRHLERVEEWEIGVLQLQKVVGNLPNHVTSIEEYMEWYGRITRRTINPIDLSGKPSQLYKPRQVFSARWAHNIVSVFLQNGAKIKLLSLDIA